MFVSLPKSHLRQVRYTTLSWYISFWAPTAKGSNLGFHRLAPEFQRAGSYPLSLPLRRSLLREEEDGGARGLPCRQSCTVTQQPIPCCSSFKIMLCFLLVWQTQSGSGRTWLPLRSNMGCTFSRKVSRWMWCHYLATQTRCVTTTAWTHLCTCFLPCDFHLLALWAAGQAWPCLGIWPNAPRGLLHSFIGTTPFGGSKLPATQPGSYDCLTSKDLSKPHIKLLLQNILSIVMCLFVVFWNYFSGGWEKCSATTVDSYVKLSPCLFNWTCVCMRVHTYARTHMIVPVFHPILNVCPI